MEAIRSGLSGRCVANHAEEASEYGNALVQNQSLKMEARTAFLLDRMRKLATATTRLVYQVQKNILKF